MWRDNGFGGAILLKTAFMTYRVASSVMPHIVTTRWLQDTYHGLMRNIVNHNILDV